MDLPHIDPESPLPLVEQLTQHYRESIEKGQLRAGDRLPTIREIASHVGVTRTTVQGAYRRLQGLGLVQATVGRGTVVRSADLPGDAVFSAGARAAFDHILRLPQPPAVQGPTVCDFAELKPDDSLFPVEAFSASIERVLSHRGPELLGYGQPTGDLDLRAILAGRTPDVGGNPDDVLVTSGAQQGLDLVLRTFTRSGDGVAVALPTYHHLFGLLKSHGLRVVPLQDDGAGLDLEELARVLSNGDVRLLYLMPTFHNPTGRTMSLRQRQDLMDLVQRTQVPVLEDEFELDLRFAGDPLPSLRSLDARGLTVTVRTFSKGLFPGVRLGWLHANRDLIGPMAALKHYMDLETSPLLQAAIVDFLRSGGVELHLTTLCEQVRKRHEAVQAALTAHMPADFTWTVPDGGFAVWVEGPKGFDSEHLALVASRRGVRIAPGRWFTLGDGPVAGFRLSLSRAETAQIPQAIEILASCTAEMLAENRPSQRPLIL